MSVRVVDRSAQVIAIIRRAARDGVAQGGLIIEAEAKRLLGLKGPGVRSLPGEPPAVQTGNLRRSMATSVEERGNVIAAQIGPQADYGAHLELGTATVAPRPFLRPALDEKAAEATKAIRDSIANAIRAVPGVA